MNLWLGSSELCCIVLVLYRPFRGNHLAQGYASVLLGCVGLLGCRWWDLAKHRGRLWAAGFWWHKLLREVSATPSQFGRQGRRRSSSHSIATDRMLDKALPIESMDQQVDGPPSLR